MEFNSIRFLIFFPSVLLVYFFLPKKCRRIWLLVSSYIFYMSWNPKYAVLIFFSTLTTFLCGLAVDKFRQSRNMSLLCFVSCILANLGILAVFKYGNMILSGIYAALSALGISFSAGYSSLLLPVGISFYTFQAIGYIIDVYRGEEAERDLINYALFVSYFPQLVAGPIERASNILAQTRQLDRLRLFDAERISAGAIRLLWGYFMKLVIADRAAVIANAAFDNYAVLGSGQLALGAAAFAFQIYCDFAAYSEIAIGSAQIMGIRLMENFNTPYLSSSIREFWDRWHISLSSWFGDYLYKPLGGSRKGLLRTELNKLIVFTVSGLWHGSSLHFAMWGLVNGIYQVTEDLGRRKMHAPSGKRTGFLRIPLVFALITFSWIFFRAASITEAFAYIRRIAAAPSLFLPESFGIIPGLDRLEVLILAAALGILGILDLLRYQTGKTVDRILQSGPIWIEWPVLFLLFLMIFIFGIYGPAYDPQEFIYFQF